MTYEEWKAEVLRLIKPPKSFQPYEEEEHTPLLYKNGWAPIDAVVYLQSMRDGEDPFEAGEDE